MRCPSNKYRVPHKIWDFIDDPSSIIIRSFISLFSDNFLLINAYYAIFPFSFSNFFAHLFVQYLLIFAAEFAHFFLQKGCAKMRNLSGEKKPKTSRKMWKFPETIFPFCWKNIYSGRRLYQLNEDDIILKFWFLTRFSQITSFCVLLLFKSLTKIESRFPCIDIYDDNYRLLDFQTRFKNTGNHQVKRLNTIRSVSEIPFFKGNPILNLKNWLIYF